MKVVQVNPVLGRGPRDACLPTSPDDRERVPEEAGDQDWYNCQGRRRVGSRGWELRWAQLWRDRGISSGEYTGFARWWAAEAGKWASLLPPVRGPHWRKCIL